MSNWRRYLLGSLNVISAIAWAVAMVAFVVALFPWSLAILGVPLFIMYCREAAKRRHSDES